MDCCSHTARHPRSTLFITTMTTTNSPFRPPTHPCRATRRQVKKINQAVLPLRYSQRFYQDLLQPPLAALCRVATVVTTTTSTANDDGNEALVEDSRVIGALCVAWNNTKKNKKKQNATTGASIVQDGSVVVKHDDDNGEEEEEEDGELWIMTLAVLAPYRSQGIGSRLLQSLLRACCTSETGPRQQQQQQHGGDSGRGRTITQIRLHVQTSNEDAIRFYTAKFGFVHDGTVANYYPRLDPPDCHVLVKKIHSVDHHHHHHHDGNAKIIQHHRRTSPSTLPTTVAPEITTITPCPAPKKRKVSRDEE
jgi:ribosomal protein S18 acetylase RimI-like enzyme